MSGRAGTAHGAEQLRANLGEQPVVVDRVGQVDAISSAPMAQVSCSIAWRPSSDDEDRRAGGLARFQVAVGLNGILQRVVLVDLDADAAAADVVEQLAGQFAFSAGSAM
jgi:hypothetical protein